MHIEYTLYTIHYEQHTHASYTNNIYTIHLIHYVSIYTMYSVRFMHHTHKWPLSMHSIPNLRSSIFQRVRPIYSIHIYTYKCIINYQS